MPYRVNNNPLLKAGGCLAQRFRLPAERVCSRQEPQALRIVADIGSLFIIVDYIRPYLEHRRHIHIIANAQIIRNCFE